MIGLIIGLIGALGAAEPAVASNSIAAQPGITNSAQAEEAIYREFRRLMAADDEAAAEVDRWIIENNEFSAKGAGISREQLNERIRMRLDLVRKGYEDFIRRHPKHAQVRVAFAGFLDGIQESGAGFEQLKMAAELDPKDPGVWNNLANYYGHNGPTEKAFECYEKAIALKPQEALYYQNYATTVFLFRKPAMDYFKISEQQVFDKAIELYAQAVKLDPADFPLAWDAAITFYGIRPPRTEASLRAWTNAMHAARNELERELIHTHLARVKIGVGQFDEAREHLAAVTNPAYASVKGRLMTNLVEKASAVKNR